MKVKLKTPIKGIVQKEYNDGTITENEEVLGEVLSVQPYAKVGVHLGATVATAPYENVKVAVWVELQCDQEEVDEAHDVAMEWCDSKLQENVTKIKESFGV